MSDEAVPDPSPDVRSVGAEDLAPGSSDPGPEVQEPSPGRIARARETADQMERRARDSYEQARRKYVAVQLASEALENDQARAGGLLAGGLAYRIFLWQVPLALFLVSALGLIGDLVGSDPAELARSAGLTAALAATIAQGVAASEQGRIWFVVLGAMLTVWAGRGVFRGARLVSQLAWGVRAPHQSSLKGSLVVTAFGLVLVSIQVLLPKVSDTLDVPPLVHMLLGLVLASAGIAFALSLLPKGDASWTAVLPGALLLGVGFRVLSLATSTYFASRLDHSSDLYGSLAIALVLMLYLFVVARLFVAAQFLNATLHRRSRGTLDAELLGSIVLGERQHGRDHHPQAGATDEVVGQVRPDVHATEPDRPDHAPKEGTAPPG